MYASNRQRTIRGLLVAAVVASGWACGAAPAPAPAHPVAGAGVAARSVPSPLAPAAVAPAAVVPAEVPAPVCVMAGAASASRRTPDRQPPGQPGIRAASVAGDTFTMTFDQGTPPFRVEPEAGTRFSEDPSGLPVTVAGSAGLAIVMTGFRGDTANNAGPQTLSSSGPLLLQVREIGDYEGTVAWAVGLSAPGCATVESNGTALAFRFVAQQGRE